MTTLSRTPLTTPEKVECAAQVLAQQAHGDKTRLSNDFGISRPTLYEVERSTHEVLKQHFESVGKVTVVVDEAQLERGIVALRAMAPNSYRAIEALLPILYPGIQVSYGHIHAVATEAGKKSRVHLDQVDLSASQAAALDELFSQGDPVLAGIDLDNGYLLGLGHYQHRGTDDWTDFLAQGRSQGLELKLVVKDAAAGIAAGVQAVFPEAEQRDDCFHALYELNKVRFRLERKAYAAIQREATADQRLTQVSNDDLGEWCRLEAEYAQAKEHCRPLVEDFDCVDQAVKQVHQALTCIDLESGQLRSGEAVEQMIQEAAERIRSIGRVDCQKVATYIDNRAPGLALAIHDLNTRLQSLQPAWPSTVILLACLLGQALGQLEATQSPARKRFLQRYAASAWHLLQQEGGGDAWELAYSAVKQILDNHHRASSAIEGFNSILRPYLYVHKSVSQNFLDLFRAYRNLRIRRGGKHKGTSAHQCLTGHRIDDWLTEIGYPPSNTIH